MKHAVYTYAMECRDYDLAYPEEPPEEYCDECGAEMEWRVEDGELEYRCEECEDSEWRTV